MKHIKLFEQFDDFDIDEFFGKEPELEILRLANDYYVGRIDGNNVYLYKGFDHVGLDGFHRNPTISNSETINVYDGHIFRRYEYKDLPKEIKDKL